MREAIVTIQLKTKEYNKLKKEYIKNLLVESLNINKIEILEVYYPYPSLESIEKKRCFFSQRIKKVLDFTYRNYQKKITLKSISNVASIDKFYFCKIFKKEVGITYMRYLKILRLCEAAKIIRTYSDCSITEVCYDVGFGDLSNFINSFKLIFGCSPIKFKNCSNDPQKCSLREISQALRLDNNNKLKKSLKFKLSSACYINREFMK